MKTNVIFQKTRRTGFTLAETLIASVAMGVSFMGLYSGLVQGDNIIQANQQNIRATQIMQQQMETIRLYTWDQINSNGYIPTNNTYSFYPTSMVNQSQGTGITYNEALAITPTGLSGENYSNDIRQVTVTVTWNSNWGQHQRQMTTFVSAYGMQNYIYQ